jgi:hypothetical protein
MIFFEYKSSDFFFYIHRHPLYIKTPKNLHIYHFYRNLIYPVACRVETFGFVSSRREFADGAEFKTRGIRSQIPENLDHVPEFGTRLKIHDRER